MLYVGRAGAGNDYLVYHFKMVFVQQITWAGANGDDTPQETVSLQVGAIQVSYTPTSGTGTRLQPISQAWNQVTNNAVLDVPGD
jgi:type VI protein secretion system component Hcp